MEVKLSKTVKTINNNEVQLFIAEPHSVTNKNILFIGVTHGEEPQGEYLINKLMKEDISIKNKLLFIPCLNPDGRDANTRGNSNGVDLNRNFPTKNWEESKEKDIYYSGKAPGNEIETHFLVEVLQDFKPDVICSLHAPYEIVNFDGPAQEIAKKYSELSNYPIQEDIGYPTPGSFGTYAGIEQNIPTLTVELPENVDDETLWQNNKDALKYIACIS